jgi:hypothetical protein
MELQREHVVSIVDDDESVRRSVTYLMLSVGFRVAVVEIRGIFPAIRPTRKHRLPAVMLTAHGDDGPDKLYRCLSRQAVPKRRTD